MTKEKLNSATSTATIIGVILFIGLGYLIYETFVIFGFWRLTLTGIVNFLASLIFIHLMGSGKSQKDGIIIFHITVGKATDKFGVTEILKSQSVENLFKNSKILKSQHMEPWHGLNWEIILKKISN